MTFADPMPGRVSFLDLTNPSNPYTRWLSEKKASVAGALHGVRLFLIAVPEDTLQKLERGETHQTCWLLGAYVVHGYTDVLVSDPEEFGWKRDA